MVIKNLKLENYRRFTSLDLEFPENIIGIIGRNGTGKTSIIEAIGWALFGNRIARTDKQDIRSQHIEDQTACSAELEFTLGGDDFRIVRKLKGKNAISEAAVYRNGKSEPEAVQDRGVNEFVERLMNLDYRSFFASIYAKQKDLSALSSMRPEDRRQSINRLINIDQIDRAREDVRRDRKEKKSYILGMRSGLKDMQELLNQHEFLINQQKVEVDKVKELASVVKECSDSLEIAKEHFEEQSTLRDTFNEWGATIGKIEIRQNENKASVQRFEADLDRILVAEKELEHLATELKDYDKVCHEKDRLDKEATRRATLDGMLKEKGHIADILSRENDRQKEFKAQCLPLDELKLEKEEKKQSIVNLEKLIKECRERVKKYHGDQQVAHTTGNEIKEHLSHIERLGADGRCPVCTQTLGDHYDKVCGELNEKLNARRTEFRVARDNEKKDEAQLLKFEKELSEMRYINEQLLKRQSIAQEAGKNLQRAEEAIVNFQSQLNVLLKRITDFGQVRYDEKSHQEIKEQHITLLELKNKSIQLQERVNRRANVEKDLERIKQALTVSQQEMEEAKSKQQKLGFEEDKYLSSKKDIEEKNRAFNEARDAISIKKQQLALLEKELETVEKDITDQEKKRKEIETAEQDVSYLDALEMHFGYFRLELAGRIRPIIAKRSSELLALTTNSRFSILELDEDYNIHIYDGNRPYPIERFSGGEQDLANLCLRLAISQVVAERSGGSPINFVVLDEIFGSQDNERRDLILDALSHLSSQFRQIFIITHVEAIKDVLPVIFDVYSRDELVSEVNMI